MKNEHLKFVMVMVIVSFGHTSFAQQSIQVINDKMPALIKHMALVPIGRLDTTLNLNLEITLPLRNQQVLLNTRQQLCDPNSTDYQHYLSPQDFTSRFGPTVLDYKSLIDFVSAKGLQVVQTHNNRMMIDVKAPVSLIEKVFHVHLLTYKHPTEDRQFFAPDTAPSIDATIPVLAIPGLNNYTLPHPGIKVLIPKTQSAVGGTGSARVLPGYYWGADFAAAYAHGVTLNGKGQKVGLVEFDGYDANDITYYEKQAGLPNVLPSVPLSNRLLDGSTGLPIGDGGDFDAEVCGDIEMAISMAPGLDSVVVFEENINLLDNGDHILAAMASDSSVRQLSSSWDFDVNANTENLFIELQMQGQSFFVYSGDFDANTMTRLCQDPNITVVGGTDLITSGAGGQWSSEYVWNIGYYEPLGSYVGTAGGYNADFNIPIPSWQQGVSMNTNQGSVTWRNVPDVAMAATNIYIRFDGLDRGWMGTSASAPLWAGFTALVNQQRQSLNAPPIGFLNPAIYAIGKGTRYTSDFNDIAQYYVNGININNNTWNAWPNAFYSVPGFDLCVGWGTPIGQSLISDLSATLSWQGTVTLNSTYTVPSGAVLNIWPGTNVTFSNGACLIVNGALNIEGSSLNPVTIDFVTPNAFTQNGIRFNSGSVGSIAYCRILNANKGIYEYAVSININNSAIANCTNGIYLYNSSPIIQDCDIHDNSSAGVYLTSSSPTLCNGNYLQSNYYGVYCTTSSNPQFGTGSTQGNNNITGNTYGVFCWNNSYPMLGQNSPLSGGYNNLVNTSWNVYNMSGYAIYANNNWWGSTNPANFKTGGTGTVLYTPYRTSSVNIPAPPLSKSSGMPYTSGTTVVPMLSQLDSAYQLIAANNLTGARTICLNLVTNYPDYAVSGNALNLIRETYPTGDLTSTKSIYLSLFSNNVTNNLNAMAGLNLAQIDKQNELTWIDSVINRYKGAGVVELALFDKFVCYYFEKQDIGSATTISKQLDAQFPSSLGATEAHRILGDLVAVNKDQAPNIQVDQAGSAYSLNLNYPNPFNPSTQISYSLPEAGKVSLVIYDVLGREVASLADSYQQAGKYSVTWNSTQNSGIPVSSGVYFARLRVLNDLGGVTFTKTTKLLLMK